MVCFVLYLPILSHIHESLFSQMDQEGGPSMEDAAGFFANVFGGERFEEYVCAAVLHLIELSR